MPKKFYIDIPIPPIKPDCCKVCPFVGVIPRRKRKAGSKKTMVCMMKPTAMSPESIEIKESERAGTRHPHHRPCDRYYHAYREYYKRGFPVSEVIYIECRTPYEQKYRGEYEIDFGDDNQ